MTSLTIKSAFELRQGDCDPWEQRTSEFFAVNFFYGRELFPTARYLIYYDRIENETFTGYNSIVRLSPFHVWDLFSEKDALSLINKNIVPQEVLEDFYMLHFSPELFKKLCTFKEGKIKKNPVSLPLCLPYSPRFKHFYPLHWRHKFVNSNKWLKDFYKKKKIAGADYETLCNLAGSLLPFNDPILKQEYYNMSSLEWATQNNYWGPQLLAFLLNHNKPLLGMVPPAV